MSFQWAKCLFLFLLKILGIFKIIRYLNRDKILVLTYHGVVPDDPELRKSYEFRNYVTTVNFEKQIKFINKKYNPVDVEHLNLQSFKSKILITFDDGFQNQHKYALPILKKYGLNAIFFIITHLVGSRKLIWTELVGKLIMDTSEEYFKLEDIGEFNIKTTKQRETASVAIRSTLKKMNFKRREQYIELIKHRLGFEHIGKLGSDEDRYAMMEWEEVNDLLQNGQFVGSHSHSHPIFSRISAVQSHRELSLSKKLIEEHTGEPCVLFSYPNGTYEDYSMQTISHLRELDYKFAFTQEPYYNEPGFDKYQVKRINITNKMNCLMFEARMTGII